MVFYSIQTKEAYEQFQRTGVLRGHKAFVFEEDLYAYGWLKEQMSKRCGLSFEEDEFPVWLWLERPDLRRSAHLPRGTEGVRLTLDLDPSRVLISDFDAWHAPLNDAPCHLSEAEEIEAGKKTLSKEKSWERIFDFELLSNSEYWEGEMRLQATTDAIRLSQVLEARPFRAK